MICSGRKSRKGTKVDALIIEDSVTINAVTPLVRESGIPTVAIFEAQEHADDTLFQMLPFSYPLFTELGALASEKYDRIALVYGGTTELFVTDAEYFRRGATPHEIVQETKVTDATDFRSEVTKILAADPDVVTNILSLDDGIKFLRELSVQKGDREVAVLCDMNMALAIHEYLDTVRTSTLEGCYATNMPAQTTDTFRDLYRTTYDSEPMIGADWGYDAVTLLRKLVDTPDTEWIDTLRSASFDGASGPVAFDATGTRIPAVERQVLTNGVFVPLDE